MGGVRRSWTIFFRPHELARGRNSLPNSRCVQIRRPVRTADRKPHLCTVFIYDVHFFRGTCHSLFGLHKNSTNKTPYAPKKQRAGGGDDDDDVQQTPHHQNAANRPRLTLVHVWPELMFDLLYRFSVVLATEASHLTFSKSDSLWLGSSTGTKASLICAYHDTTESENH